MNAPTTEELRELLEKAAKAYWGDELGDVCSAEWSEADQAIAYTHADNQDHNGVDQTFIWNPADDDGESRRLEVALKIHHRQYSNHVQIRGCWCRGGYVEAVMNGIEEREPINGDPCAAARLAVLRCAAAIWDDKQ